MLYDWYNYGYGAGQKDGYQKGFNRGYVYREEERLKQMKEEFDKRRTPKRNLKEELNEIWEYLETAYK